MPEPPRNHHRCPVCGGLCAPVGKVDFNKCCEEARGKVLPSSGRLILYVLCAQCAFCYAPEFASWTLEDFEREIYNEDYVTVDPDYIDVRPRGNANMLLSAFCDRYEEIAHLDYGGGRGLLSDLLRQAGWQSASYDPFVNRDVDPEKLGRFNLITCYEVFEHVPDPAQLARTLSSLLARSGLVLFSTLVSDRPRATGELLSWWYASPRNGHISLFSSRSLGILAVRHGFTFGSFSAGMHAFWHQQFPPWASHLLRAP